MPAQVSKGWLSVPFVGDEVTPSYIRVGERGEWRPAYLDWDESGARIAKIRPPENPSGIVPVWLKNGYEVTESGVVRL